MGRRRGLLIALLAATAAAQEPATHPPALPAPWRAVAVPDQPGAMAPDLWQGPSGPVLTWLQPDPERRRSRALLLGRLGDDGFLAPRVLRTGTDFFANWADFATGCAVGDAALVHFLRREKGPDYGIALLRTGDQGEVTPAGAPYSPHDGGGEHGFVSMLPEDGGVRLFWLDGRRYAADKVMELRTALWRQGSVTGETVLDPDVCTCCQTAAALVRGQPLVVYRGRRTGELRDIAIVRRTTDGWSKPALVADDSWKMPGCPVNGPAVAAAGERVAVAWFTGAGERPSVRLAWSHDAGAAFTPPLLVDQESPVGRVALLATTDGVLLAWLRGDAEATLAVQEWTPQGPRGPRQALDLLAAGRASGFPRLLRHGDDALLAWTRPQKDGTSRIVCARASLADLPGN